MLITFDRKVLGSFSFFWLKGQSLGYILTKIGVIITKYRYSAEENAKISLSGANLSLEITIFCRTVISHYSEVLKWVPSAIHVTRKMTKIAHIMTFFDINVLHLQPILGLLGVTGDMN